MFDLSVVKLVIRSVALVGKYKSKRFDLSKVQSSGAVWESRWPSWAFRPNEPSGFLGRKAVLNHAHPLVSACPYYVNRHPRTLSNTTVPLSKVRPKRFWLKRIPLSTRTATSHRNAHVTRQSRSGLADYVVQGKCGNPLGFESSRNASGNAHPQSPRLAVPVGWSLAWDSGTGRTAHQLSSTFNPRADLTPPPPLPRPFVQGNSMWSLIICSSSASPKQQKKKNAKGLGDWVCAEPWLTLYTYTSFS